SATAYTSTGAARYVNPPWYAMVMIPLSWIPFAWLYPLWTGAGLVIGALAIRKLKMPDPYRVGALILLSASAFLAVYYGQNTFFMVAILTLVVLALERGAMMIGGIGLAFIGFKPHLLLGIALWWITDFKRMKVAISWVLGVTFVLAVVSALWMPGSWREFFNAISDPDVLVMPSKEVSVVSAVRLLFAGFPAVIFVSGVLIVGAIALALVLTVRRNADDIPYVAAMAIAGSLLIAPRALVYDWLLLVVAGAVILWAGFVSVRNVAIAGALLAVALPIGDFLTELQLDAFDRALHIAPLVLLAVFVWGLRRGGVLAPSRVVAQAAP
ncbi:MAG: glycosyltransferase family 87 protein, partial [Acidimicrobiia bacterium]